MYLCVAGLTVLLEVTWCDVHVFITLNTLPQSCSLADATLSQSWERQISCLNIIQRFMQTMRA